MPLANAATIGVVFKFDPNMLHSCLPPCSRACCNPSCPGFKVDPDTIAARESSVWLFPLCTTSAGNFACLAASIYSTKLSMIFPMSPLLVFLSPCLPVCSLRQFTHQEQVIDTICPATLYAKTVALSSKLDCEYCSVVFLINGGSYEQTN